MQSTAAREIPIKVVLVGPPQLRTAHLQSLGSRIPTTSRLRLGIRTQYPACYYSRKFASRSGPTPAHAANRERSSWRTSSNPAGIRRLRNFGNRLCRWRSGIPRLDQKRFHPRILGGTLGRGWYHSTMIRERTCTQSEKARGSRIIRRGCCPHRARSRWAAR